MVAPSDEEVMLVGQATDMISGRILGPKGPRPT